MDVKEFEALKKDFEAKKTKKIQLETQKSEIEKSWQSEYGTTDPAKIEAILAEKKEEITALEGKREKLVTELRELLA